MKDTIERTKGLRRQAQKIICQAYERGYKDGEADAEERYESWAKEDELKPCPFCDGHASMEMDGCLYCASCDDCGATGARMYGYEDAAEAWNRRASDGNSD